MALNCGKKMAMRGHKKYRKNMLVCFDLLDIDKMLPFNIAKISLPTFVCFRRETINYSLFVRSSD